ncbi:MAG: hypothetical protein WA160_15980 [Pseudobdellovibrio sp.]
MSSFKTLFISLVATTSLLTISTTAHADLMMGSTFFEPSIGYKTESLKLTDKLANETSIQMNTPVYGLKIGYRSMLGIDVNLAGDYASGKASYSPLQEKNSFSHTSVALQLGVSALDLMKIYLGYAFLNDLKIETGLLNSDITLKGPAYQAGVQFKLFSGVFVAAQYNLNQFKTISGKSYTIGDSIEQYYSKLDSQDYSFNISTSF